jgi:hypothetical protein
MASVPESRFCLCCEAPSRVTPAEIWNRPGLPAIAVRIGTFGTFREAMLQDMVRQSELAALATRESDDYAVTIVELFAAVGDVLTFYTERIANEMYLVTARERDSVNRLVRLIGYRLRPGLAATAMLAFTLDAGALTRIRRGLKVMSIPGQDERPQIFEALEELAADARLNALPAYAPPVPFNAFHLGRREAPLAARPASLSPGDRVVFFGLSSIEEKTVVSLTAARDGERLAFAPPVQTPGLWPGIARAAKVERRLRFFGHDAPDRYQAYDTSPATPPSLRWKTIVAGSPGYELDFNGNLTRYPLESRDDTLAAGARLLVDAGPGADPRLRTAVVRAVDDAPAALGEVPNTAPHRADTVTHMSVIQTVIGRPTVFVGGPGVHLVARSGVGRVLALTPTAPIWDAIGTLVASDDLAAAASGPAVLHLFARDAGGALQRATWAGGAWGGWSALGLIASARPAAVELAAGEVLIATRNAFLGLHVRTLADPAWLALGGVLTSPPVPVSWGGSRVDVFVRGLDRALWRITRSGGSWSAWESLGGRLATTPAAASTGPNRLDVVALDDDGALVHRRWTGSAWTDWHVVGGRAKGEPAIVATAPNRVDVFVRGDDDQLWQIARIGATWSPWVPRGGSLASAPYVTRGGGLVVIVARDVEGAAVLRWGNGTVFTEFLRVGGGLGHIPDRRRTRIFVTAAPEIEFRDHDYPPRLAGGRLAARLADAPALDGIDKGRRVIVEGGGVRHLATVKASLAVPSTPGDPPDHLLVDFSPPLAGPVERAVLVGNVTSASHGETQPEEPLGSGDATRAFPSYRLKRAPLTYLPSETQMAGVAELEVRVNGERWLEVPSLYGRRGTERIYTARQNDAGETELTFGDGRTGGRLPTGAGNILARYRTGLGLEGRVKADQLAIPLERPVGLRAVTNPLPAEGGANPESRDDARASAPTTVRTFGRAVSLQDFAWLATSSGLVARAHATWVWRALEKAVHLSVAGPGGAALSTGALRSLHAALTASRDPNRVLLIGNVVRVPLVVRAKVLRDAAFEAEAVAAAAREALLAHVAFEAMPLGRAVHASDVYAALHGARGVVAIDLDLFHLKGHAGLTAIERTLRAVTADPVQEHVRIFEARPTPGDPTLIDRYARAGFTGAPPPVLAAEQAFIEDPVTDVELTVVEAF